MRADVNGDKRSLCVEHARRDGRGELVCGGGGEGGESREKELMWWAYEAVRMEEEMKENAWREACESDQEMETDIDEEKPIEFDDDDSHADVISISDDAESTLEERESLEEDESSSSEEEDEDPAASDETDAPEPSAGAIRCEAEEDKEEEERAALTSCLPRSIEITKSGQHILKSPYILSL